MSHQSSLFPQQQLSADQYEAGMREFQRSEQARLNKLGLLEQDRIKKTSDVLRAFEGLLREHRKTLDVRCLRLPLVLPRPPPLASALTHPRGKDLDHYRETSDMFRQRAGTLTQELNELQTSYVNFRSLATARSLRCAAH